MTLPPAIEPGHRRPPGPRSKRTYDAVMAATVAVLVELGYSALTIEGVAARAQVGKSTIYRWWPTKAVLVLEALRSRSTHHAPTPTGHSRTDLRAVIAAACDSLVRSPVGHILPALAIDLDLDPAAAGHLHDLLQPRRDAALAVVRSIIDRGDLPADTDPTLVFEIYSGALLYRALLGAEPVTDGMIDQLTDLLLTGKPPHLDLVL